MRLASAAVPLLLSCLACGEELSLASSTSEALPERSRADDRGRLLEPTPLAPVVATPQDAVEPRLGPPYPIVLVHGFSGWSDAGPLEYFFGVLSDLEEHGETDVYAPALPPYNSSDERALVLAHFIDDVLEETGRQKVHLIGHSQGGIDSRRVVSGLGYAHKVASVTTVASPHEGTPLADSAGLAPSGALNPAGHLLAWLIGAVDSPPNDGAWQSDEGSTTDPWDADMAAAAWMLSTEGMAAFNEANPDPLEVPLFSVAAYSNLLGAPALCDDGLWEVPSRVDAVDPLLLASGLFLSGADLLEPRANDGILPTDCMVRGQLLGCVPADHFDEIGQIGDLLPGLLSGFSHKALYRKLVDHARSLEEPAAP